MAYIYDLTDTWSAAGTVFNGIKLNVTNSASAAASKLITLQIGGTEHFSVTKAGVGYFSGNVGIGTSSPVSGGFLTVGSGAGSSTAVQYLNAGSGGSALLGRISGNNSWFIGDTNAALGSGTGLMNFVYGANPWIVYLNNAERMRIDASGNLLVGTTTSYGKISVYQTAASPVVYGIGGGVVGNFVSADVTNAAVWNFGRDNVSTGNFVHSYNGTVLTSITTSGNLLLGTTSAGASATKVIGMANATAPTTSPAGMGQLYVEGGALKFRGSSGTVTTIAPA